MSNKKQDFNNEKPNPPQKISDSMFFGIKLDEDQMAFAEGVWSRDKKIYLVNSVAGTGKTLISVALGVLMVKYGFYQKVVYVTFPGIYEKTQGFLPGDLIEKSDPYFQPLRDALIEIGEMPDKVCNTNPIAVKNGSAYIECAVSTYMRGINLKNSFVIIDEAENADLETLAKVISRINDDCLCVIIGHSGQCDMYDKSKSGFTACIDYYTKFHPDICAKYELYINHRGWISKFADLMLSEYDKPAFGFIYMTKNLVTGKLYLGKHIRTMNPEDIDDEWYLGSGKALREAFVKYGKENFERTIIRECDSLGELDYMEKIYLEYYNAIEDDRFYNIVEGGGGHATFTEEQREKMRKPHAPMSEEAKKRIKRKPCSEETRQKLAEQARKNLTGRTHTKQSRANMAAGHIGSVSVFKDGTYKYIKKEQLEEYLSDGWIKQGAMQGNKFVTKDGVRKSIPKEELQDYLDAGWQLGRSISRKKNEDDLNDSGEEAEKKYQSERGE